MNAIGRVHGFLEAIEAINVGCPARPAARRVTVSWAEEEEQPLVHDGGALDGARKR